MTKLTTEQECVFAVIAKIREAMDQKRIVDTFGLVERLIDWVESLLDKENNLVNERDSLARSNSFYRESHSLRHNCRDYLMAVDPNDLTVEDCLEALGFGRNGLNDRSYQ